MIQFIRELFNIKSPEQKRKEAYLKKHGFDHKCPSCGKWESAGNHIKTKTHPEHDELQRRQCTSCGHEWDTIFTPAGFVSVDL